MKGLVLVLLAIAATAARAEPQAASIVLVADDPELRVALDDVLGDATLVTVDAPTPALGDLGRASRELADAHAAAATIWLSAASTGSTLVAYHRTTDRFLVRELPHAPPLTATQAAEAARMVRTMLRALDTRETTRGTPREQPRPAPVTPPSAAVRIAPPGPLAATAGAGAWLAAPGASATPQLSLGLAWRPDALGVALTGTLAPAAEVTAAMFDGRVLDRVLAGEVRRSLRVTPAVRVVPGLGLALHAVHLSGTTVGAPVDSWRLDPAVRTGITVAVAASAVELGVAVSADCLLRRQEYVAGTERILVVPRVQVLAGIQIGIRLPPGG